MNFIKEEIRAELGKLGSRDRPVSLAMSYPEGVRDDVVLPQRVVGKETICGGNEYSVLGFSDRAGIQLKELVGRPAELRIRTDRGGCRRVCGIVTAAAAGQSDGALASYELTLSDGLAVMEGRTNTRIFRKQSELDIVALLIREWRNRSQMFGATFDVRIDAGLGHRKPPQREFIMQHNESDAAFIRRLLRRRGIGWFFEPGLPSRGGQLDANAIGHTMVVFDDVATLHSNAAGSVRFHRDAATEERDAITLWSGVRTLRPGSVSRHSWDYKNPIVNHRLDACASSGADQGECGNDIATGLEDYQVSAPHLADNMADFHTLGGTMADHYLYAAKCFHGEGGVRDLAVGEWFRLQGHPDIDTHPDPEREFVVTAQDIAARNNLPVSIEARVERLFDRNGWGTGKYAVFAGEELRRTGYRTRFSCVRRGIPIVPEPPGTPRPALQTAIVVGPAPGEVWCDDLARVKIRFIGTRTQDHTHAAGAGSSDSDNDSAWVRVASSWAGSVEANGAVGGAHAAGSRYRSAGRFRRRRPGQTGDRRTALQRWRTPTLVPA